MLKTDVLAWLAARHRPLLDYWQKGSSPPVVSLAAHCDMIYALTLLGEPLDPGAVDGFVRLAATAGLPGWRSEQVKISVHNCAYLFGALNLLGEKAPLYEKVLHKRVLDLESLVDYRTMQPRFPIMLAHHIWRVGHWIGGVPSIIVSVAESGSSWAPLFRDMVEPVLQAAHDLVDGDTHILRPYDSPRLQALFRRLYALRHDPKLADLGGTAHLLWADHVTGQSYAGLPRLLAEAREAFHQRHPFMEAEPYCLDFDIVQLLRTGLEQSGESPQAEAGPAAEMMGAIEAFFAAPPPRYRLHKLPGALAAYHECALLAGMEAGELGAPIDIIKRAHWI